LISASSPTKLTECEAAHRAFLIQARWLQSGDAPQESAMDRRIAIAVVAALTLATVVKIETAANTGTLETTATIQTQPATLTQPDLMWLVGP
jgi:hypothetical protein